MDERLRGIQKQNERVAGKKSFWPAKSVERGAAGFGDIIEEQLQLKGMRRRLPGNKEKYTHTQ